MFTPGLRVGVAVSGGADSIFLLHLLHELAPRWNLHLSVVHIDHGIRGAASLADADFVRQAATRFALPFHLRTAKVTEIDDNLEQAARGVRHEFFSELIASGTVDRVATGHTRSDQAETVLYRLLRGSGLAGLCGILPVTESGLLRPLLDVDRSEIEAWLRFYGIEWREDATNQDRTFARNRLRHEILPLLRDTFNPQLDSALSHVAVLARDEEDWWTTLVGKPETSRTIILEVSQLTEQHPALVRRRIRQAIQSVKGDLRQVNFSHVETVLELARSSQGSGRVQLPGLDIFRSFDWIRIAPADFDTGRERNFSHLVPVPGTVLLPEREGSVHFDLAHSPDKVHDKVKDELDWQCLTGCDGATSCLLELRNWRPGDQYRRIGQAHPEKIKFLFQEARVPLWERRHWPVLVLGGRIVWTRRFGPAAQFAANAGTREILRVREQVSPEL